MLDLNLGVLPQMAQEQTISWLAPAVWVVERVVALWLGGSLARGEGDAYSDIDLRVAVDPADLEAWRAMDTQALTGGQVAGGHTFALGEDAFLRFAIEEIVFVLNASKSGRANHSRSLRF